MLSHFFPLIWFLKVCLFFCRPGEPEGQKAQLPVEKKAQDVNLMFPCGRWTPRRNKSSHSCLMTDQPPTPHSSSDFLQHSSIIEERKVGIYRPDFPPGYGDDPLGRCCLIVKVCCGTSVKAQELFGQSTWTVNIFQPFLILASIGDSPSVCSHLSQCVLDGW